MTPLFTCVVPSLNQGRFLRTALESLFAQGDDLEVIVVDGGSTDGSVEILREHSSRLAWWCSEADGGQSAAFNKGFAHARGEWLFWLNADDVLLPGALARVRAVLEGRRDLNPRLEWIAGNELVIDEGGRILRCLRGNAWHDGLYRHAVPHVYGPSSFFTRDLFLAAGGFDENLRVAMDFDLWIRFMRTQRARRGRVGFLRINDYLWAWRMHDGSKTSSETRSREELRRQAQDVARAFSKNDFEVTRGGNLKMRLWRLLDGSYVRGWMDTRRWKGCSLEDFAEGRCP